MPELTADPHAPHTRYLICTRCDHKIDVKFKQLEVKDGFRIISCTRCKWRGRSQHLQCECRINWLLCNKHRADPPTHQSNRPPRRKTPKKAKPDKILLSNRLAPLVRGNDSADRRRMRRAPRKNLHMHHPEAASHLSPEYAASLLYNWKRQKTQSHSYTTTDSGGGDRGPSAPSHDPHTSSDEQSPNGLPLCDPSSSSTSTSLPSRPWPGSSYSGSEVPCIVPGRLPILDLDTIVHPPIDDSGRLPPWTSGDNKDGENDKCQPAPCKRRRTSLIDAHIQRDSLLKDSAKLRPASRTSRLLSNTNPTSYTPDSAEGRARSRSR